MGQHESKDPNAPCETTVEIPREYHKYIVGTKGATIQKLESESGKLFLILFMGFSEYLIMYL